MSLAARIVKRIGLTLLATTVWGAALARTGTIAEGPAPDLFLLYTGDVIGHIEPCG